jgi:hypothetical protein
LSLFLLLSASLISVSPSVATSFCLCFFFRLYIPTFLFLLFVSVFIYLSACLFLLYSSFCLRISPCLHFICLSSYP